MPIDKSKISNQELLIKTATTVELLNTRLFGGDGQVGALPYMLEKHEDLVAKLDTNKKDLLDRIDLKKAEVDKDIKEIRDNHNVLATRVNWFAGGISSIVTAGTLIMTYLGLHHKAVTR